MYNTPEELRKSQTGVHLITFIPSLKLTDFDKYNGKPSCFLYRIEFLGGTTVKNGQIW